MSKPLSLRPAPLALACALASAASGALAGNVSYFTTPVTFAPGTFGQARALNDAGDVAVWVSAADGNLVPRIWSGAPVATPLSPCCGATSGTSQPLFFGEAGRLFGRAQLAGSALVGIRYDPADQGVQTINSQYLPTGSGAGGAELARNGSSATVSLPRGSTTLPVPAGAASVWAFAGQGAYIVGKSEIGGLGQATVWKDGQVSMLLSTPSLAYDVNAQGQWVGLVGSGANSRPAVGWGSAVTVLDSPFGNGSPGAAIAINENGQVLAGDGGNDGAPQPGVSSPFLWSSGRSSALVDLVEPGVNVSFASAMNEHGQILAWSRQGPVSTPILLTPRGTLAWSRTTGGSFLDTTAWDSGLGFAPNKFLDVRYDSVASQGAWLDRDAHMLSFSMGSGSGRTQLDLLRGALLRSDSYVAIEANGVLGGDGRVQTPWMENRGRIAASNLSISGSGFGIDGSVYNSGVIASLPGEGATLRLGWLTNGYASNGSAIVPGRLRVDAGQSLRVEGNVTNYGTIEVFGGQFSHAGPGPLVNVPADQGGGQWVIGRILARDATLRFESGVQVSGGQMAFSGGVNDVFGRVEVLSPGMPGEPEGQVIVSGRAEVTFWDPVHNNGELRVSAGSTATFFGLVSGAGRFTGSGTKFLEGGFAPGNSPALVTVEGDLSMGARSPLLMELGGTAPGSGHDKLAVGGMLTLAGGPLQVLWWNGFSAAAGDRFDLLDWGTLAGSFGAISLPALAGGLQWDTSALYTLGELRVAAVPEPGRAAMLLAGAGVLGWVARRRRLARD